MTECTIETTGLTSRGLKFLGGLASGAKCFSLDSETAGTPGAEVPAAIGVVPVISSGHIGPWVGGGVPGR